MCEQVKSPASSIDALLPPSPPDRGERAGVTGVFAGSAWAAENTLAYDAVENPLTLTLTPFQGAREIKGQMMEGGFR